MNTPRRLLLAGFVAVPLAFAGPLAAQSFSEFPIPTPGSLPSSLTVGSDGNLWFTEYGTNKIGRITPAGVITEYAIPYSPAEPPPPPIVGFPFPIPNSYSGPIYIEAGSDGALWFTEPGVNKIGRITTAGSITEFRIPTPSSLPGGLTDAPDGSLWFVEAAGNKVARITTSGVITEFAIPTPSSLPTYIKDGPDGNLWFTESNGNKIGRITPAGVVTEFPVPTLLAVPADIKEGSDGALWFTEALANKIGRITTTGAISEFPVPGPLSVPANLTTGPDKSIWFTEAKGDRISRLNPAGTVTSFNVPTPGSLPVAIELGPDGNLWFTEALSGKIGRLRTSGGSAACAPSPTTLCLAGGRFQVRMTWRVPLVSTGPGMAAPVTGDTGNFWFFSANSMEVEIKIVDGRAFNNRFWVFYGALTNVEYTITVTDTVTGKVKTYFNPFGKLESAADLFAF